MAAARHPEPDSKLVGFTAFVTGAAYGSVGFSAETQISSTAGPNFGNLEDFAFMVDGTRNTATDRNFWGVTFTSDDNEFYATAASAGHTWLVRGDLAARTLTAIKETAECPSASPDGRRVAYKKNVSTTASAYWSIAVLDLATGKETVLPEKRNVDDQVEWLDDSTILYGMPRTDSPGDSDIWSIPSDGASEGKRFIQHAWSPSVELTSSPLDDPSVPRWAFTQIWDRACATAKVTMSLRIEAGASTATVPAREPQ